MEIIFSDLSFSKNISITAEIIYRPPKQAEFLKPFAETLNSLNAENKLSEFNINVLRNFPNFKYQQKLAFTDKRKESFTSNKHASIYF